MMYLRYARFTDNNPEATPPPVYFPDGLPPGLESALSQPRLTPNIGTTSRSWTQRSFSLLIHAEAPNWRWISDMACSHQLASSFWDLASNRARMFSKVRRCDPAGREREPENLSFSKPRFTCNSALRVPLA
jgi:hypothetical protein